MAWNVNEDEVTMTSADGSIIYVLHSSSEGFSCVDSYKLYGGPLQPFEYVVLNISKKRLSAIAPTLMGDIRAGRNLLTIYGLGDGGAQYVVTNCKTGKDTWKITAYPQSEGIRSYTTTCDVSIGGNAPSTMSISGEPAEVIRAIIEPQSQSQFAAFTDNVRSIHTVIMLYRRANNHFHGTMTFKTGTSMWYILSICALRLGCNMWASNDTLYVIDFSLGNTWPANSVVKYKSPNAGSSIAEWSFNEYDTIFLNTEGAFPYNPSPAQKEILNNVIGTPSPEQEGRNLIKNNAVISINNDDPAFPDEGITDSASRRILSKGSVVSGRPASYNSTSGTWSVGNTLTDLGECKDSQEKYGIIQYDLSLPEATRDFAQKIADNIVTMYCDSEQPISFTMRETEVQYTTVSTFDTLDQYIRYYVEQNGTLIEVTEANKNNLGIVPGITKAYNQASKQNSVVWNAKFDNTTRIRRIVDYSNDLVVSTASNLNPNTTTRPAKGMISRWVRNFPEHTTTYTFGEIAPTDMTQNNSVIHTAIKSGGM